MGFVNTLAIIGGVLMSIVSIGAFLLMVIVTIGAVAAMLDKDKSIKEKE